MPETRIIKFGDQDWKVTPFHCVVGPIDKLWWDLLWEAWLKQLKPSSAGRIRPHNESFVYPTEWREIVAGWRREAIRESCWAVHFENNPLIVNEMEPEEVTLACVDDGKLILTNFRDLPGIDDALKVYTLGEFWLSYATGGDERSLRFGGPRR